MKPPKGIFKNCLGVNGHHDHLEGCDGTEKSICRQIRKKHHIKSDPKSNLLRTEEYYQALDWVHERFPGRVGPEGRAMWESEFGKQWSSLRVTPEEREREETDVRTLRKEITLQVRSDYERQQEARTIKVTQRHNNEQIEIQNRLKAFGLTCSTEKDFADVLVEDILGEVKVKPDKGEYMKAFGQLYLASEVTDLDKKFMVSVGKKIPKTILELYNKHGIAAISKINGSYQFQNSPEGFEKIRLALQA